MPYLSPVAELSLRNRSTYSYPPFSFLSVKTNCDPLNAEGFGLWLQVIICSPNIGNTHLFSNLDSGYMRA